MTVYIQIEYSSLILWFSDSILRNRYCFSVCFIWSRNILIRSITNFREETTRPFCWILPYISNSGNTDNLDNSSLCFKDGPQLPPLNFTLTCVTSGRYVIFYNERLDGVTYPEGYEVSTNVYTELCEVYVNGK